mmetsp:Transcript_14099/g.20794  ORF Transcript_14099/g.20794 Transcript_14099/m.20794 type:complete len:1665 (+) Transcript_14099:977-5971(+)
MKDAPERFFDWTTPFHGAASVEGEEDDHIGDEEEEEAMWIMGSIPDIASEYFSPPPPQPHDGQDQHIKSDEDIAAEMEKTQRGVLNSIIHALRFMHKDKLEPEFIRRYRADVVTSPAVRKNINEIMDEDTEWDNMCKTRNKVESLMGGIQAAAAGEQAKGAEEERISKLTEDLRVAQEKLDESLKEEETIKGELDGLGSSGNGADKDDDDDELFGNDDDDDDEAKQTKKKLKSSLESRLKTVQELQEARAETVAQLATSLRVAEAANANSLLTQSTVIATSKKICQSKLLNVSDYRQYLSSLTDVRHVSDVSRYLNLIREGNEAVRSKNALAGGGSKEEKNKKRSRRFDRDYYRTCVSEGLRSICYQFTVSPFRAGIMLEDNLTLAGGFSYDRILPGEEDLEGGFDPKKWAAPVVDGADPTTFASDLVGSGELVLLSSTQGSETDPNHPELKDPLRGCRYVAAMELAYEPRIRRHLRSIYRANAVMTTKPTSRGFDNIDAFHEYFGLHLIRNKPIKEHFPMDEKESEQRKLGLSFEECRELDEEVKQREKDSCLQFLNILKAEATGDVASYIHLPLLEQIDTDEDPWFKHGEERFKSRDNQDLSALTEELERVYLPPDGDTDEWNEERRKVLRLALTTFLLPQFEAEARRDLREASIKIGIKAAAESLYGMAMEGPYRPSHLLGENRFLVPTGDLPIVGVCCATDSKDATYLAGVTERGELKDHLAIPGGTRIDGNKMKEKVITFLMQSRPAAVVVGTGGGVQSRLMARKLGDIVTQAMERWNNCHIQGEEEDDEDFDARINAFRRMYPTADINNEDDEDFQWKCNVDIVEDNVAQLFGRSIRGKKEFPDFAVNLKCAIAVARHAKDPLGELTYAWSVASDAGVFGAEMLYLNVHPLQRFLPKPLLLRQYERVLCNAVAEVGVDVNGACTFDHMHGMLTFVPGLGPRKAAALKQGIDRIGGVVPSRKDLLARRLLGPVVFTNSVAFLRIRDIDRLNNQFLFPLDDTRLHPDVYTRNNWAVKIAIDALELESLDLGDDAGDAEDLKARALRDVMQDSRNEVQRLFDATKAEWEGLYGPTFDIAGWNPREDVPAERWRDKVEELDLDTFADMIEQSGLGKWLSHLVMIKWEFRLPFEDPRKPMEPLAGDKLFRLLTGETDLTLCPGKEVTGRVFRNGDFGSRVKLLEGDVPGFIPLRNLADTHVESAEDIVKVGDVITAIVTEVKKDHMCVDLSLKMEHFRKLPSSWERPKGLPPLDMSFDKTAAMRVEQSKNKAREAHLAKIRENSARRSQQGGTENGDTPLERTGRVTRRTCTHPAFRNAKHAEVDNELRSADTIVGDALVRPSNRVADSLAVHWLVRPGCIRVIEVTEKDKERDDSIGKKLIIKGEVYGDIDELIGRYVDPMNARVQDVQHHRKFLDMLEDDVDHKLRELKKKQPGGVFYFLCWNESHPGYLSLRYIMNKTARSHHIGISPDGYVWGKETYVDVERLLNEFKKNPHGPKIAARPAPPSSSGMGGGSSQPPRKPAESKPSRWGSRPAPPPPAAGGYGAPPAAAAQAGWGGGDSSGGSGGWNQPPPPSRPPPPPMPPPPQGFQPPPPSGPPPSFGQPPPSQFRPPPPSVPPPSGGGFGNGAYGNQPPPPPGGYNYQQPPPPPGGPPPGYPPQGRH